MANLPFFYDAQIRRIIIQMMRVFSGFRYQTGVGSNGQKTYETVQVVYGDGDRQAQHMLTGNSENTVLKVPRIAVYISGLRPAQDRGSYNGNINELNVTERAFDHDAGQFTSVPGRRFKVERLQPNPIDIQFKVDIWTSNTEQKFQIFEQIYMLFNPDLDIQSTNNPLDWTSLQTVKLEDITWSENGLNTGTDDTPDILGLSFTVASWISPPSRVQKQKIIDTIMLNIGTSLEDCDNAAIWEDGSTTVRDIITPGNHWINVYNSNRIMLLGDDKKTTDANGNIYSWQKLLDEYGQFIEGQSRIRLRWVADAADDSKDIIGFVTLDPLYDNIVDFTIQADTLPIATLTPIIKIIDPHSEIPGSSLPAAVSGQRYIVSASIGQPTIAWGNLVVEKNSIIEYNGSNWIVSYDASTSTSLEFVNDSSTGQLLKFVNGDWVDAINGFFGPGYFRIDL